MALGDADGGDARRGRFFRAIGMAHGESGPTVPRDIGVIGASRRGRISGDGPLAFDEPHRTSCSHGRSHWEEHKRGGLG